LLAVGYRGPYRVGYLTDNGGLAIKSVRHKELKRYLLLADASAAGMVFFIILHNFLTPFFDEEPATFIMGIFVCPVAYIVGMVKAFRLKAIPDTQ